MYHHKMKLASIFLIFGSLFLLASCGGSTPTAPSETTPPIANPTQVPKDTDSQWNPDPAQNIHVTNLGGDQVIPRIVTGDNGDFYVNTFAKSRLL